MLKSIKPTSSNMESLKAFCDNPLNTILIGKDLTISPKQSQYFGWYTGSKLTGILQMQDVDKSPEDVLGPYNLYDTKKISLLVTGGPGAPQKLLKNALVFYSDYNLIANSVNETAADILKRGFGFAESNGIFYRKIDETEK